MSARVVAALTPCTSVGATATHLEEVDRMIRLAKQGKMLPTPLNLAEFERLLSGYDEIKRQYVLDGLKYGFKLEYKGIVATTQCRNHPSIMENIEAVRALIQEDLDQGRIVGPFNEPPFQHLHLSPISLRPKSTPGKFRLIHNLSSPYNFASINSNILQEDRTVTYESISTIIQVILNLGRNTNLAKTDIKSAFRLIPVHYNDYHLLGFHFEGKLYFDRCLSMGSASSCRVFEEVATAINWILRNKFGLLNSYHYLDDFCLVEEDYYQCKYALETLQVVFKRLGVPIAVDKT